VRRPPTRLLLALTVPLALAARPTASQEPPVFGVEAELVRLDVVVLDRDGQPIAGLSRDDFEIEEDGHARTIETFEPVVVPQRPLGPAEPSRLSFGRVRAPGEGRAFFVFFDDTHVSAPAAENARRALREFVQTQLREGDWFTLTAPGQGIWWTARDAWEYEQLASVIDRLKGEYVRDPLKSPMTEWQAAAIVEGTPVLGELGLPMAGPPPSPNPAGGEQQSLVSGQADPWLLADEIYSVARKRISVTLGSLRQAVDSLTSFRGHKAVLLVSEGFILAPRMTGYAELIDAARRANVALYPIDPRGLESGYSETAAPALGWGTRRLVEAAGADDLAVATGGRTLTVNDPARALEKMARESEVYYLLGFAPEGERGKERKLKVRVKRDGVTVRARTRYYLDLPEKDRKEALPEPKGGVGKTEEEREAMRAVADTTDLPLRLATLFFENHGKGQVTTMYATEIRMPVEEPGKRRISTVAEAFPRDGGKALRDEFEDDLQVAPGVPTILSRHWYMPPGVWQARVLVRDKKTGRIGTVIHTFEVPSPDSFRLSTPILTTQLEEVDGRPRPRVVLNRTFRSGQTLYCQFQVHGAATDPKDRFPKVVSGYELQKGDSVVHVGEATPIKPEWDGRLARLMGLSLRGVAPGSYTLVLEVTDELTGKTLDASEPFTVAP
jgi:VWFA-related protein